ncbi:hypothetical protein KY290_020664 [Solanum tuberosum]|uniref:Non-LTR retroelement reverse transcriptase n=1 Tax=Solanum tuberosum TaxID=4113 RepID=A0ABQ7UZF5_SOLTU|nr:hypothetical protein KY290_020664 [Solanum tuberosum]
MEHFQEPSVLEQFKRKLGMNHALVNTSAKIWIFWREDWVGSVILDSAQQLTMKFIKDGKLFFITSVYARCNALERLELWEDILQMAEEMEDPWLIGGDFNVILNKEEKLGDLAFTQSEAIDFAICINNCALEEIRSIGSKYTDL